MILRHAHASGRRCPASGCESNLCFSAPADGSSEIRDVIASPVALRTALAPASQSLPRSPGVKGACLWQWLCALAWN